MTPFGAFLALLHTVSAELRFFDVEREAIDAAEIIVDAQLTAYLDRRSLLDELI